MFKTKNQPMAFSHFHARGENHGPEKVKAVDLSLSFDAPNTILNQFQDGLMERWYEEPEQNEDQDQFELDGEDQVSAGARRPVLACTKIKKLNWDEKYPGYRFLVMNELEDKCDVLVPDVTLKGIVFQPKQGGTVNVSLKIACYPQDDDIAVLWRKLFSTMQITLEPPSAEKLAELEAEKKVA